MTADPVELIDGACPACGWTPASVRALTFFRTVSPGTRMPPAGRTAAREPVCRAKTRLRP